MASTGSPPPGGCRSLAAVRTDLAGAAMNIYYVAAIWLGMALLASAVSIRIAIPAALVEIVIGAPVRPSPLWSRAWQWSTFAARAAREVEFAAVRRRCFCSRPARFVLAGAGRG